MRLYGLATTLLLGLILGATSEGNDTALEDPRRAIVSSCNAFSARLYQAASNKSGNLVISPVSAQIVLTMAWLGATGETARELSEGLHLPKNRSYVQAGFRTLLSSSESTSTITLDMAIKMYIQEGMKLKAPFRQVVVNDFRSDVEETDFVNATEEARTSINQWVGNHTHDKITDLIAPGTLSEDTRLVAVNAIYFKGGWLKPFKENNTVFEPFYTSENNSIDVPMMHQTDYFYHSSIPELEAQAIKLFYVGSEEDISYKGSTKSMIILLPDAVDGLPTLEDKLSSTNLTHISNTMSKREINLALPKFKAESSLPLEDSLGKLGISKVFAPGAELSGISEENTYLSKVIQKAYIDVSEKGTEAAVATYFELINFIGSTVSEMNVNHPFLYYILDEENGAILLIGRVVQP